MTQVTPIYQWPTPELPDSPNVPSDMGGFASAVEATVADIDARARRDGLLVGRLLSPGASGNVDIALPFQPQLVQIVTNVTTPSSSSLAVSTFSTGRIGFQADGTQLQDITGIRIIPGSGGSAERRVLLNACGGLLIDDTTEQGLARGTITPAGFTLNILDTTTTLTYFWTAWE